MSVRTRRITILALSVLVLSLAAVWLGVGEIATPGEVEVAVRSVSSQDVALAEKPVKSPERPKAPDTLERRIEESLTGGLHDPSPEETVSTPEWTFTREPAPDTPSEASLAASAAESAASLPAPVVVSSDMADIVAFEVPDGAVRARVYLHEGDDSSVIANLEAGAGSAILPVTETGYRTYSVEFTVKGRKTQRTATARNDHVQMSSVVGTQGATLASSNGEVVLTLPAGAFESTTTVSVTEREEGVPSAGILRLAGVYDITPSGPLGAPATLKIAYDLHVEQFQIAARLLAAAGIMTLDEAAGEWVAGASDTTLTAEGYLQGRLTHFSYWTGATIQPHGTNPSTTDYCTGVCHDLSAGGDLRLDARDSTVCYFCHGNTLSTDGPAGASGPNIQGAFYECEGQSAPAGSSTHPVGPGDLYCTSCHNPHADPVASPGLLRSYDAITGKAVTSGAAYCWTCHGVAKNRKVDALVPGYWTRTDGDKKTYLAGTPHASIPSTSGGSVGCLGCHGSHSSASGALLKTGQINGKTVSGNDVTLCLACHDAAVGAYAGQDVFSGTPHATVSESTVASTTRPGSDAAAGDCQNCHDPHGTPYADYLVTVGSQLCRDCHDVAGAVYPAGYSYQGPDDFSASGHSGIARSMSRVSLTSSSAGFSAWRSTVEPTPSSPGVQVDASGSEALASLDGVRLITSGQSVTGAFDYQMYRFKLPVSATDVVNATLSWSGYGEDTPGYPVAISLWRPGTASWVQVASRDMGSQQTVDIAVTPSVHADAEGYIYVMAKARYVYDGQLVSGPTFTGVGDTSIRVDWTTAGITTSYVDWGATTSYGSTAGSATRTTSHSVTVSGLTAGTWHFRVRSTSPSGENYTSSDHVYALPRPTVGLASPTTQTWYGTPVTTTVNWNAMGGMSGPYSYRVQLWYGYKGGTLVSTSGWTSDVSRTYTDLNAPGYWSWRVEARDVNGISHGWSDFGTFYISDGVSGSCPFLFTWDGEGFSFEADLFGAGKMGTRTKTGVLKPAPDDPYLLDTVPVATDGTYEFRLVEERFETDYLDQMRLYTVDVPDGYDVYAEKYQSGGSSYPGLEASLHTVRLPLDGVVSATHVQTGRDVTSVLSARDGERLTLNEDRNAGFEYQTIELDLGDVSDAPATKIVMDAISLFPTNEEGALHAAEFGARTILEVQDADGSWVRVPATTVTLPKPPEFSRPYAFDVSGIWVSDSRKVRLTFLFKTLVDWIAVDTSADVPVSVSEVPMLDAELRARGIDPTVGSPEVYEYVYGEPTGDTEYFAGAYTRFGDVTALLSDIDDRFVIFGGGDEVALRFDATAESAPADGTSRRYLMYTHGYYKDAKVGLPLEVEPLPFAGMSNYPYGDDESYPADAEHEAYRAEWNTRYEVGGMISAASRPSVFTELMDRIVSSLPSADVATILASTNDGFPVDHRSLNTDQVTIQLTVDQADPSAGECLVCHAVHGATENGVPLDGGRAASDGRTCTADGTGGCHDDAANSYSGVDIRSRFTANSDPRAHHDVMRADQLATGGRTACADCHNPHVDSPESRYVDPDDVTASLRTSIASAVADDGSLYILVGAAHDGLGPVISAISLSAVGAAYPSPTITWATDEPATSWIDWGLTTAYELGNEVSGSPFGNDVRVTSHTVQMSGLSAGVTYHYRIRSTDALGNTSYSADRTYKPVVPPPAPVMSDLTTVTGSGWGPIPADLAASTVSSSDGHAVEYQFNYAGPFYSDWLPAPALRTLSVFYDGTYTARVRARDAVDIQAVSAWSAYDSFAVTNAADPSGSCPFLFTWDGEGFSFEADLFGAGKMGTRTKTGVLKPAPDDPYLLDTVPVATDGTYEFRLVEERFETDYLDQMRLYTVDVPDGYDVYAEKYQSGGSSYPGLEASLHTVRLPLDGVVSATHVQTGRDVTSVLSARDGERLTLNEDRNAGFEYQTIELDLGDVSDAPATKIVMDAISLFPTNEEGALHAAEFGARTILEVQDADGSWVRVPATTVTLPKPPEFSRPYAFDVSGIWVSDSRKVRLTFLFKTLVDWIAVDTSADVPVSVSEVPMLDAELRARGIDPTVGSPEVYEYVYGEPTGDTEYFAGAYTRFGDVTALLSDIDDRFVIFGGGDEVALRFDATAESAPADGTSRRYLMYTHGYYKDAKVGLPLEVEPLPFAGMSNYPYGDDESYPADAEHEAYRAEWNTRYEDAEAQPGSVSAMSVGEVGWRDLHSGITIMSFGSEYSVDTDYARVSVLKTDDTTATVTLTAGWESASPAGSRPTPGAPGTPVSAGTLSGVSADDGVYWRTGLAVTDRDWNWQVLRFDLGTGAIPQVKDLAIVWNGHGEPTSGYATALYYWDPLANAWTAIRQAQMAADTTVSTSVTSISGEFCLRCHDGAPPDGVVFPAGSVNVGSAWTNASTGDYHGARSGDGFGTAGLKAPYVRGQSAISCAVCHDTHGTQSLYHIPSVVNERPIPAIVSNNNMVEVCRACHEGTAYEWHLDGTGYGCWCHYVPLYETSYHDSAFTLNDSIDCVSCHKHGTGSTHPAVDCEDCHGSAPRGIRAF